MGRFKKCILGQISPSKFGRYGSHITTLRNQPQNDEVKTSRSRVGLKLLTNGSLAERWTLFWTSAVNCQKTAINLLVQTKKRLIPIVRESLVLSLAQTGNL